MKKKKILWVLGLILLLTIACNLNDPTPSEVNVDSIATSVALTLEASGQNPPPNAALPSPLPQFTNTPELTPTATFTPTITLTPTPSIPVASVSVDTNCRTGPSKVYDFIGALLIGEKAEIVGKNTSTNYWIIKNPDSSGTCWLWGYYATIAGNTANLQEYAIPPTPTPLPTSTPVAPDTPSNLAFVVSCFPDGPPKYKLQINISWDDNSDNEDGFIGYMNGAKIFETPADITQFNAFSTSVDQDVPVQFSVSAFHAHGESTKISGQVSCP